MSEHRIRCECGDWDCTEILHIEEEIFVMARAAKCAIVVPGHQEPGERILRRGDGWITVEEPMALVDALTREATRGRAVLVDCLTLWLSNLMLAERDPDVEARRLTRFLGVA